MCGFLLGGREHAGEERVLGPLSGKLADATFPASGRLLPWGNRWALTPFRERYSACSQEPAPPSSGAAAPHPAPRFPSGTSSCDLLYTSPTRFLPILAFFFFFLTTQTSSRAACLVYFLFNKQQLMSPFPPVFSRFPFSPI